jgi:hypothetical protein
MRLQIGLILSTVVTEVMCGAILSWNPVTDDVFGVVFPESVPIEYTVFIRPAETLDTYTTFGTTAATELDVSLAPTGCNEFVATASRLDISPPLDSSMSNSITVCDYNYSRPRAPQGMSAQPVRTEQSSP